MRKQLSEFITQFNIRKEDRFLIAISGGIDSVALTHLMHTNGFSLGLAHFNYQLRGEESEKDEEFVKQLAANWNLTLHSNSANTKELAAQQKKGIQELARDLRYEWFQRLAESTPYNWIVTAHHLNDSVETTILNLTKGTGLRGLKGIPPVNQNVIRPLIYCSREDISAYAKANQLHYRLDASNEKMEYQRNLIRLEVIPPLKSINPSLENSFLGNYKRVQGYLSIVDAFLEEARQKLLKTQGNTLYIDGKGLLNYPAPETILFEWVRSYGFNAAQVVDTVKAIPENKESVFYSNSHQLTVSRGQIAVELKAKEEKAQERYEITEFPASLQTNQFVITADLLTDSTKSLNYGPMTVYFDADKIELPLVIRHWKHGDRFQPFGMGGKTKKLSDCFTDWKLNSIQKRELLIVESGGNICWVVGHRGDHRFTVGQGSKILRLTASEII